MNTLPTDTYYRGYRLSTRRADTPYQSVAIRAMGDPGLLSLVTDVPTAHRIIDAWLDAR